MEQEDFVLALTLFAKELPFESIIMAAMLRAPGARQQQVLIDNFPEIWQALQGRLQNLEPGGDAAAEHDTPGGI